jgi:predicted  nucleic acid-binding Zn-ribbon protein
MTVEASALREIHRLHQQKSDLQSRLDRGPRQVKASEANLARLEAALEEAKEALKRTRMNVDSKNLSLKERESRILDVRARLNSASSNKEYQTFMEQMAADEQANSVLSDEIIELLDKSSADEETVQVAEASVTKAQSNLKAVQDKVTSEKDSLESDLARVKADLAKAELALPSDVRQEYQRKAKVHGEDTLAPLDGEVCGGCYQRCTPQMINELTMSKVVFCKNCGCILYLPEDTSV